MNYLIMVGSSKQGRETVQKLVYQGETFNLSNYGSVEEEGTLTIYGDSEESSSLEWIESDTTITPSNEREQLQELLQES